MKRILIVMIMALLMFPANANSQEKTYKANGESRKVCVMDNLVYVYVSGGKSSRIEPYFILDRENQVTSFRNSLIELKNVYGEYIQDPKKGTGDSKYARMPVKFKPFDVGWTTSDGTQHIGGNGKLILTYAVLEKDGKLVYECKYSGKVSDKKDYMADQLCMLVFVSEEDIQSLIDALPVLEE